MSKQRIIVNVEVPEGYELTGEYRAPKASEHFISASGTVWSHLPNVKGVVSGPRFILRPAWQPPKCSPDGCWVYSVWDGEWFVCMCEPKAYIGGFTGMDPGKSVPIRAGMLAAFFGETFTPPPVKKIQVKH